MYFIVLNVFQGRLFGEYKALEWVLNTPYIEMIQSQLCIQKNPGRSRPQQQSNQFYVFLTLQENHLE